MIFIKYLSYLTNVFETVKKQCLFYKLSLMFDHWKENFSFIAG